MKNNFWNHKNKVPMFIKKAAVAELKSGSTNNQMQFLADSLHKGRITASYLFKTLKASAPKEMNKGANKLLKKGITPTVDLLMKEYQEDKGFQELAAEVGLFENYFVSLAEVECNRFKGDK